jgi:hypothetical protein
MYTLTTVRVYAKKKISFMFSIYRSSLITDDITIQIAIKRSAWLVSFSKQINILFDKYPPLPFDVS